MRKRNSPQTALEYDILLLLMEESYGQEIFFRLRERLPKLSAGSLYSSLNRMAKVGWLCQREETKEEQFKDGRGGRKRVYYHASTIGRKFLDERYKQWKEAMKEHG